MESDNYEAVFAKGEGSMTDLQFSAYVELRDKYEALLKEVVVLRLSAEKKVDSEEADYRFRQYEELRDKCDELSKDLTAMRRENARLRMQEDIFKNSYKR